MSLRRAVAVIQATGLSGIPCEAQSMRAEANASCNASSARSNDCETRIRLAMMRPLSRRKIDSIVPFGSLIHLFELSHFANGTDLYVARSSLAGCWNLGCPVQSFVQVPAIEDVVARQLLLRFRKRTVRHQNFTVFHPHGCRRV